MVLMPTNPSQSVGIDYTPEFKRALRKLVKKYHHIRSDLQPVIMLLQKGELVGDRVSGVGNTIFKARVRNSDIQKGKRSGYRLIYWQKTRKYITLVTIYSKLDQGDISAREIKRIIKEFEIRQQRT
jgi:mRNA-degrading endonuclease RelE of RelBE toxin-antitoxin system